MRFRSGTLGRSIKRWGPRFPTSRSVGFKKKQFGYFYFDAIEPLVRDGTKDDFILFNKQDFSPSFATGCRNVSMDLRITLTISPASGDFGFSSWGWAYGCFVLDQESDDTFVDAFGENRALFWEQYVGVTNTFQVITGDPDVFEALAGQQMVYTKRIRAKQRFMKYDDELRLICRFNPGVEDIISLANMRIFGRVSWEMP